MNDIDISSTKYDLIRNWIRIAREKGESWEVISNGRNPSPIGLSEFLESQTKNSFWPEVSEDVFISIVKSEQKSEEDSQSICKIISVSTDESFSVPESKKSLWQRYKELLKEKNFKVDSIENDSLSTLQSLRKDPYPRGPVKGLVVGNVQSGKTANMAGLIAMAADYQWKVFIVLTGTIENLRDQTDQRLYSDLELNGSNLVIRDLSSDATCSNPSMSNKFDFSRTEGFYLITCLKNSQRLTHLIQWLRQDPNKYKKMHIIVIDDEADLASINTADIKNEEISKISGLIQDLVNETSIILNKGKRKSKFTEKCASMNYIAYTATPYGNILNECTETSLYPKDFVCSLSVSDEYFGPQQIFGLSGVEDIDEDENYNGLDIVRKISAEDLAKIKEIHKGKSKILPQSFIDSLCWFLCGVAQMRCNSYTKPISMLVHTSSKTDDHDSIAKALTSYFKKMRESDLLSLCKSLWEKETLRFSKSNFENQYPKYSGGNFEAVKNYSSFEEIKPYLLELIRNGIQSIYLNSDGVCEYCKGIHLCIDNCKQNPSSSSTEMVRLIYPNSNDESTNFGPAFIVIGGATLSRGLTLEGLISSYFLRNSTQADSLMQMGRWFGYRKGYELIPRIWLTDNCKKQFEFLSNMDYELREEIYNLRCQGKTPSDYAIKVRMAKAELKLNITSKNKSQSSVRVSYDYTGTLIQTFLFDNNQDQQTKNFKLTELFFTGLGEPNVKPNDGSGVNNYVWKDVSFKEKIQQFLKFFSFQKDLRAFSNLDLLIRWVNTLTAKYPSIGNWNVIFVSKENKSGKEKSHSFSFGNVIPVTRSKRKDFEPTHTNILNIGVLVSPTDLLSDIDRNIESCDDIKHVSSGKEARELRSNKKYGLSETPQLLVYLIDKDSKARSNKRNDLEAVCDIVGLAIHIPSTKNIDFSAKVCVNLKRNNNDDDVDIEDQ